MIMPHPLNRRYQLESYQRIINSSKKFVIIKLKPGIGKTALAAQAACDGYQVMSCVMTKSLEWQYVNPYGFVEIFGKGNYSCNGYGQQQDLFNIDTRPATADLCECPDEFKAQCKSCCEYPLARQRFVTAQAGVTNYSKFLSDRTIVNSSHPTRGFDPQILFYDECHLLHDEVIKWSGLSFSFRFKRLMSYCKPIMIDVDKMDCPLPIAQQRAIRSGIGWLTDLLSSLNDSPPKHPAKGGDVSLFKWWKRTIDKVDVTLACLDTAPTEWYIYADRDGIEIKPKTARFHFKQLFNKAPKIVLMSGTIQPKDIKALGLERDEYEFISMPNPFEPADRPVYDLNCPKITWKSTLADCGKHAQIISDAINKTDDHWITLVHFPSKKKTWDWANRIRRMTGRPVWVPEDGMPTDKSYDKWIEFKDNNPGAIACAWQFWVGVDGGYLNNVIVADVPYPNFSDRFEKARFQYDPGEARVRVANCVEQGSYRNRRGTPEHYGASAEKFNAIAGGDKFNRLRSAFDKDFLASVRKV